MAITPEMNLDLPVVSSTLGPEWASLINAAFEVIDAHDHATGNGVKVTPAGININAALTMAGYALQSAASVSLANKVLADTDELGSIQRIDGDLYWVTPAGAAVQLTDGDSIVNTGGLLSVLSPGAYPYTISSTDNSKIVLIDTTAARTINLPAASTGEIYCYIKDESSQAQTNNISIVPNGSDEIDNVNSTYVIDWNDGSVGIISDGVSNWHLF